MIQQLPKKILLKVKKENQKTFTLLNNCENLLKIYRVFNIDIYTPTVRLV